MSPPLFKMKDTSEELPMRGVFGPMPRILWCTFFFSRGRKREKQGQPGLVSPDANSQDAEPCFGAPFHHSSGSLHNECYTYTHTNTLMLFKGLQ